MFSQLHCLVTPRRDLGTNKQTNKPNIEIWPQNLGVMLEFQYVERGLFDTLETKSNANMHHIVNNFSFKL